MNSAVGALPGEANGRGKLEAVTQQLDARQLEPTPHVNGASQRVLIVDDDGLVLRTLRAVLEDEGYTVDTATNVRHALERAIRHCPALVVLDMGLPPFTGAGVVAGLQAAYAKPIPILMISADGHAPEKAKLVAAFAYLVKPFDLGDLLVLVRLGLSSS